MIADLFNEVKPVFVSLKNNNFHLRNKAYEQLEVFIQDVSSVRKLFEGKRVECYSNDGQKGKNGQFCAICPKRMKCQRRIRLMLVVLNPKEEHLPAQLEINKNSFGNLKTLLESIAEEELSKTLILLNVKTVNKYLQIQFTPVF